MAKYEYRVVPAPTKGRKAKGIKSPEGRFAQSVEDVLNRMGVEGWEYLRAELLPSSERSGLTSSTTNWRNVLVFRRPLDEGDDELGRVAPLQPDHFDDNVAPVDDPGDPMLKPVPGPGNAEFGNAPPVSATIDIEEAANTRTPPKLSLDNPIEPVAGEADAPEEPDDPDLTGIERALRRNAKNTPDN